MNTSNHTDTSPEGGLWHLWKGKAGVVPAYVSNCTPTEMILLKLCGRDYATLRNNQISDGSHASRQLGVRSLVDEKALFGWSITVGFLAGSVPENGVDRFFSTAS